MESHNHQTLIQNLKIVDQILSHLGLQDKLKADKNPVSSLNKINSAFEAIRGKQYHETKINSSMISIQKLFTIKETTHTGLLKFILTEFQKPNLRKPTRTSTASIKQNNKGLKILEKDSENLFVNFHIFNILKNKNLSVFKQMNSTPLFSPLLNSSSALLELENEVLSCLNFRILNLESIPDKAPLNLFVSLDWKNCCASRFNTLIVLLSIKFSFFDKSFGGSEESMKYSLKGIVIKCNENLKYVEMIEPFKEFTWENQIISILVNMYSPVTLIYSIKKVAELSLGENTDSKINEIDININRCNILKLKKISTQIDWLIDKKSQQNLGKIEESLDSLTSSKTKSTGDYNKTRKTAPSKSEKTESQLDSSRIKQKTPVHKSNKNSLDQGTVPQKDKEQKLKETKMKKRVSDEPYSKKK